MGNDGIAVQMHNEQVILLMSQFKISSNQTGTVFYSKMAPTKPYRVRFQSYQQGLVQNKNAIAELHQIHTNYNVFKQGQAKARRGSQPALAKLPVKLYKNMKERSEEGEGLRVRLKSMRQTRQSIFQQLKSLKE